MIVRPVVILGAPRSGTTILQRCLAAHPELWHLAGESHAILEGPFHPARSGYESNRVTADCLDEGLARALRERFYRQSINLNRVWLDPGRFLAGASLAGRAAGRLVMVALGAWSRARKPEAIRFLEKTPKNSLRVPMLDRLFPDALFIWLKRRAAPNIDSLVAGWLAVDRIGPLVRQRYAQAGYPLAAELALQDYHDCHWKFALVPGWRALKGRTIADVAAWQYYQCNRYLLDDLARIDPARVFALRYEDFVREPAETLARILDWATLPPSPVAERFARILPRVNDASPGALRPRAGLRHGAAVSAAIARRPEIAALQQEMGYAE